MARDPYQVLGVARDATADQIKRAYRKLAKQYHPDVNQGDAAIETKFKDISAAHDLLADAEKRARYDRGEIDESGAERPPSGFHRGHAGAGGGRTGGFGGFDPDDIFEMFSQAGAGRAGGAGLRRRGADVTYSLRVAFVDAAVGSRRRITLPDGRALDVAIPAGADEGAVLRLKGQGQPGANGGPNGDAFIEIHVEPHAFFERRGADIHLDLPISLAEAVLGASVEAPTIEGPVALKVPRGSNSGAVLRLKGRGVVSKSGGRGDQYIRLAIHLPDRIDPELTEFAERWSASHSYDPRAKLAAG